MSGSPFAQGGRLYGVNPPFRYTGNSIMHALSGTGLNLVVELRVAGRDGLECLLQRGRGVLATPLVARIGAGDFLDEASHPPPLPTCWLIHESESDWERGESCHPREEKGKGCRILFPICADKLAFHLTASQTCRFAGLVCVLQILTNLGQGFDN